MNQNVVVLVGRIAIKPQLKAYKKGDGTEGFRFFSRLAVTRLMDRGAKRDEQRASFVPIVAWGEQAKRHAQYLNVGTECTIVGELIVDSKRNEDGTFGPDMFNVTIRDCQYGQPGLKGATLETLQRRKDTLDARMAEIQASLGAAGPVDGAETPAAAASAGTNPFTPDGTPAGA